MNALFILIPATVLLVGIALWAFFWAIDAGQFDDLDTPALEILEADGSDTRPVDEESPR